MSTSALALLQCVVAFLHKYPEMLPPALVEAFLQAGEQGHRSSSPQDHQANPEPVFTDAACTAFVLPRTQSNAADSKLGVCSTDASSGKLNFADFLHTAPFGTCLNL